MSVNVHRNVIKTKPIKHVLEPIEHANNRHTLTLFEIILLEQKHNILF